MAAERKKGSTGGRSSRSSGRGDGERSSSGRSGESRSQGGSSRSGSGRSGTSGGGRGASGAGGSRGGGSSSSRGSSSTRGGASRRGGLGDDQGTRVGSPDASARGASGSRRPALSGGYAGPSTQPVKEGLEGSILEGASGYGDTAGQSRSTGAGSEASEGIHGASSRRGESSRTSTTTARTGSRDTSSSATRKTGDRSGSEPMRGSDQQHISGYGGAGGTPKTSSDQREPTRKREEPVGGSRKRGSRAQGGVRDEEGV